MSTTNFHILAKPIGPICNLDCKYCFYLEKESLYPEVSKWAMREEVLDSYIRQYVEAHDSPVVTFTWQGGEPTLLGVEYFRRIVEIEKKYANGKRIQNAFQTNGVLLNECVGGAVQGKRVSHRHINRRPARVARCLPRGQRRPAHLRPRDARPGDAEVQWRGIQHSHHRAPRQCRPSARCLSLP